MICNLYFTMKETDFVSYDFTEKISLQSKTMFIYNIECI